MKAEAEAVVKTEAQAPVQQAQQAQPLAAVKAAADAAGAAAQEVAGSAASGFKSGISPAPASVAKDSAVVPTFKPAPGMSPPGAPLPRQNLAIFIYCVDTQIYAPGTSADSRRWALYSGLVGPSHTVLQWDQRFWEQGSLDVLAVEPQFGRPEVAGGTFGVALRHV